RKGAVLRDVRGSFRGKRGCSAILPPKKCGCVSRVWNGLALTLRRKRCAVAANSQLNTVKKYNVGIIGYGWVASAHIPAINATSLGRVTAVCSSRKLDADQLSLKHGGQIKVYHKLDELLADPDIDVVSLCSLQSEHAEQTVRA